MATNRVFRILVVDDEADITEVMRLGLEKEGFKVVTFNDPIEAKAQFREGAYDLVLLDVSMKPKMVLSYADSYCR